jgi:TonB family protein
MPGRTGVLGFFRYAAVSLIGHVALAMGLVWLVHGSSSGNQPLETKNAIPSTIDPKLVFLAMAPEPRPPRGGGGSGNHQPGPIRRAQAPGTDSLTLLVAQPIVASAQPPDRPAPQQGVVLAAKSLTSGLAFQIGSLDRATIDGSSQGPGDGGRAGEGTGSGDGPGIGPGLGDGSGGNTGGGIYQIGNGVTPPALLFQVKPAYTSFALRAKIQGSVLLEAVVQRDGTARDIRIRRSLDPSGLDGEAIHALEQWRFRPGRFNGVPVDVRIIVQLDFNIQ